MCFAFRFPEGEFFHSGEKFFEGFDCGSAAQGPPWWNEGLNFSLADSLFPSGSDPRALLARWASPRPRSVAFCVILTRIFHHADETSALRASTRRTSVLLAQG